MSILKYDIYYFDMEYSEDFLLEHPRFKHRPCVVKEVSYDTVIVMSMITSKKHHNQYAIRDWKYAGLTKPSYINFNHTQITSKDKLGDYIGHLSDFDIQRIKSQKWDESLIIENN